MRFLKLMILLHHKMTRKMKNSQLYRWAQII